MKNRKRNGSCRQVVFDGVLKTKRMCIFFFFFNKTSGNFMRSFSRGMCLARFFLYRFFFIFF